MKTVSENHARSLTAVLALSLLTAAAPARAYLITIDPTLPPAGQYVSPGEFHEYTAAGIKIGNPAHSPDPFTVSRTPQGLDELEQFDSTFAGEILSLGGIALGQITLTGLTTVLTLNKLGKTVGTFYSEILSMNLSGVTPMGPVLIRESPTLATLGQTTITDIGGGLYKIESFFEVFTDLSIDGGQSWIPSATATRMTLVGVPDGGTTAAMLGLALLGLAELRRRHRGDSLIVRSRHPRVY